MKVVAARFGSGGHCFSFDPLFLSWKALGRGSNVRRCTKQRPFFGGQKKP